MGDRAVAIAGAIANYCRRIQALFTSLGQGDDIDFQQATMNNMNEAFNTLKGLLERPPLAGEEQKATSVFQPSIIKQLNDDIKMLFN